MCEFVLGVGWLRQLEERICLGSHKDTDLNGRDRSEEKPGKQPGGHGIMTQYLGDTGSQGFPLRDILVN